MGDFGSVERNSDGQRKEHLKSTQNELGPHAHLTLKERSDYSTFYFPSAVWSTASKWQNCFKFNCSRICAPKIYNSDSPVQSVLSVPLNASTSISPFIICQLFALFPELISQAKFFIGYFRGKFVKHSLGRFRVTEQVENLNYFILSHCRVKKASFAKYFQIRTMCATANCNSGPLSASWR